MTHCDGVLCLSCGARATRGLRLVASVIRPVKLTCHTCIDNVACTRTSAIMTESMTHHLADGTCNAVPELGRVMHHQACAMRDGRADALRRQGRALLRVLGSAAYLLH